MRPEDIGKERHGWAASVRSTGRLICCLICCLNSAAFANSSQTTLPGTEPATPESTLTDLDGNQHRLGDYRGKVVLLHFWTSWCPPCIREMPGLKRLSQAMAGKNFVLLAVNVAEGRGIVHRFTSLRDAGIRLLRDVDGSVANAWDANVYPTSVILDGLGRRHNTIVGEIDWDGQDIYDQLHTLIRDTTAESQD